MVPDRYRARAIAGAVELGGSEAVKCADKRSAGALLMASPHDLCALLRDQGFDPPEPWIDYARKRGFRPISARRLYRCPNCGAHDAHTIGQYVYFSHLARLRECTTCELVYSDVRLPADLSAEHFEYVYKDKHYFGWARGAVNAQLARLVTRAAQEGARVLDVGAATGRLMAAVRQFRPDLDITVSDISQEACWHAERAGFTAVCSDIAGIDEVGRSFDVVVMSDVIYLEPQLERLWAVLPRLLAPGALLVVRIPNKLTWIRLCQRLLRAWAPQRAAETDRVPLFNPEHLYIFPPRFLCRRLRELGFIDVQTEPARSLRGRAGRAPLIAAADAGAWMVHRLLPGRPVLSPSLILTARREVRQRVGGG